MKLTYLSGTDCTLADSISFCFGFYLTSTRNEGESIWKTTGIGEGDWLESFVSFTFFLCLVATGLKEARAEGKKCHGKGKKCHDIFYLGGAAFLSSWV